MPNSSDSGRIGPDGRDQSDPGWGATEPLRRPDIGTFTCGVRLSAYLATRTIELIVRMERAERTTCRSAPLSA